MSRLFLARVPVLDSTAWKDQRDRRIFIFLGRIVGSPFLQVAFPLQPL